MGTFLFVVVVVMLLGWYGFVQSGAREQLNVLSPHAPGEIPTIVHKHFGLLWARVEGEGQLNYRARMRKGPPTLSVSLRAHPSGGTEVTIWMSRYESLLGLTGHAQLAWRKKRSLASLLAE